MQILFVLAIIGGALFLLTRQASIYVFCMATGLLVLITAMYGLLGTIGITILLLALAILSFCAIKPLRRTLISSHVFKMVKKNMPEMSTTERDALEAGTISFEGNLFTGSPDFHLLREAPVVGLTPRENAFMDGPVDTLCRMIDDWDITHNRMDMPKEMWQFIRENRFLGMIIPEEYGGLGFSATAQMSILARIYGRSVTVATTISVPNSLGPAELLLKYGTEEQKSWYLPRLADGREIPCFALTAPNAGSDAASITDSGIVCYRETDGKKVLGISLTWNKRYITLCPVATVIGLAFQMYDPENILGKGKELGITCALIPADTEGVHRGRRHFPLNAAFLNGPTQGKNVFVPIDCLIGGQEMAGHGWRMLMECLSAGRAISLPSSANGGAQVSAMVAGAYARIRRQFNQPICRFEGIEEPLARIVANTYMIDSGLTMAAAAIDHGAKPSVAGAILKYHCTEKARQISMDVMDIHGGKGICLGPRNYLGRGYQNIPIAITVEGANILTRSLIIFGQGVIRCHPYIFREMEAVRNNDLVAFDNEFFAHAGFFLANTTRSLIFNLTDGYGSRAPDSRARRYYQLLNRYCAHLAFLSDFSMITLGSKLKRKEKTSARLGDMLSSLYFVSAILKRFYADGEPPEDLPIVDWSCQQLFHECDMAMLAVISNFRGGVSRAILRLCLKPFGSLRPKPSDDLGQSLARLLTTPSETRDRLIRLVFREPSENCPAGQVDSAFLEISAIEALEKRMYQAMSEGKMKDLDSMENIFTSEEISQLKHASDLRDKIIAVDDFSNEDLERI